MSQAYDMGYESGMNNDGEPLHPADWHSEAHARGFVRGIEALIENEWETPDADPKREEGFVENLRKTNVVIDQIIGGKDHQNTIQAMAKEIERLREELEAQAE